MSPTLYGFIPQTFCGREVAELCATRTGRTGIEGDKDPMDICVLSEKSFTHGSFFLHARPIGGLRMIDGNEADDKIVAVLAGLIDRLKHYFLSYKQLPSDQDKKVEIVDVYDRAEAQDVITRSLRDYEEEFGRG